MHEPRSSNSTQTFATKNQRKKVTSDQIDMHPIYKKIAVDSGNSEENEFRSN